MSGTFHWSEFKETLLFLITAGVVVPLFHRIKISPVIGFIMAGAILGPFGLGRFAARSEWLQAITISQVESVAQLAEFGVVFLLFMVGLELSWERLSRLRRLIFGLGSMQVLLSALLIAGLAAAVGLAVGPAVVLGFALALSSTAIIIPVLSQRNRMASATGEATFAVLLFQDLSVAPLLVMVTILGNQKEGATFGFNVLLDLAPAIFGLLVLVLVGRLVLRPLFRLVAAANSTELFMAACLLVIVGAGVFAGLTRLSMATGAFIAGLLLAETEFRREIEVTIEPFQGLLLGLFFVSVGASLDLAILFEAPLTTLGLALGLVLLKASVLIGLTFLLRLPRQVGREMALTLAAGGEFAFVMLNAAMDFKIVPMHTGQMAIVVVTLSMITIPVLAYLGERAGRRALVDDLPAEATEPPPDSRTRPVIIVGYGRVGQLVGDMLARHNLSYVAVDSEVSLVAAERGNGKAIHFGDASRLEFLRRCGIGQARGLVVTMDAPRAVEHVVSVARAERPDMPIVARARDAEQAAKLYHLGATAAVPETIEASLQLSEALLIEMGVPMGFVIASIHERRDLFRAMFSKAEGQGSHAIRRSIRSKSSPPRSNA